MAESDDNTPTLSIIMPAYNAENHIYEAVESILAQSYSDFELVVINDGSTDRTAEIINYFNDDRISLLNNDSNRGIVFSRNRGILHARGRYIAPFDADDIARRDKFDKQISFLEANPEYGLIGSWAQIIDAQGKRKNNKWKVNASAERIPAIMLFRNYFVHSAVVLRREAIPVDGYAEGFDTVEDYRMWASVVRSWKIWNYPDYLVKYRLHNLSITQSKSARLPEKDKMVFRFLYEPLQIDMDEHRLSLLQTIKSDSPIKEEQTLKDIEAFLLLLIKQNNELGLYDSKQLRKVVLNRWLKTCQKARGLKHKCLYIFIKSPLLYL
jgi:glycosyltransferase involved in cell wall biosynthesis